MNIIERGVSFEEFMQCDRCKAKFTYTPLDLEEEKYTYAMIITCPECKKRIQRVVSDLWREVRNDMLRDI